MNKLMDFIRNRGLMKIDRCLIWPKSRATVHEEGRLRIVKDSDRVGTPYVIDIHTQQTMDTEIQNDRDRAQAHDASPRPQPSGRRSPGSHT